jgi:hypothetical protein
MPGHRSSHTAQVAGHHPAGRRNFLPNVQYRRMQPLHEPGVRSQLHAPLPTSRYRYPYPTFAQSPASVLTNMPSFPSQSRQSPSLASPPGRNIYSQHYPHHVYPHVHPTSLPTVSSQPPSSHRTVQNHHQIPQPRRVRFSRQVSHNAQQEFNYHYHQQWRLELMERLDMCIREFEQLILHQQQEFQAWLAQAQEWLRLSSVGVPST